MISLPLLIRTIPVDNIFPIFRRLERNFKIDVFMPFAYLPFQFVYLSNRTCAVKCFIRCIGAGELRKGLSREIDRKSVLQLKCQSYFLMR